MNVMFTKRLPENKDCRMFTHQRERWFKEVGEMVRIN